MCKDMIDVLPGSEWSHSSLRMSGVWSLSCDVFCGVFLWCGLVLVEARLLPPLFVDHHVLGRPLRHWQSLKATQMGLGFGRLS